ncbi:hypothetical protein FJN17_08000 [Bradyrhizobium symbiodeficiens]|uniref:Uncharacterized protein n=1 Tax=Bradyrhizobium symbiodeficiens TaxID=1404367 RepID=A0ABX5W2L5_9BRAD|nr:hypothetical protein [Bradyrhizobium symbiodeficiens]QDF37512.1 hypothetical protein FJN17_08000 [Bradyrhizobium symbiodeficiens]
MRLVPISARMRYRPLPFARRRRLSQPASARLAFRLPPAMAWRKRSRKPGETPPRHQLSVTNMRVETNLHPTRQVTLTNMRFAWLRPSAAASPDPRRTANRLPRSPLKRARQVDRILNHHWRILQEARSEAPVRSGDMPIAQSRPAEAARLFAAPLAFPSVQPRVLRRAAPNAASPAAHAAAPIVPQPELRRQPMIRWPAAAVRPSDPRLLPARPAERPVSPPARHPATTPRASAAATELRLPASAGAAVRKPPAEVAFAWRKAVSQAVAGAPAADATAPLSAAQAMASATTPQSPGSRHVSAASMPPQPSRPSAAIDPAFADRLANDVIRRIERRQRIERERRGL